METETNEPTNERQVIGLLLADHAKLREMAAATRRTLQAELGLIVEREYERRHGDQLHEEDQT